MTKIRYAGYRFRQCQSNGRPPAGSVVCPNPSAGSATRVRHSASALGSEDGAKPAPLKPDCLVAHVDPALGQQVLDVAQRQRVLHVVWSKYWSEAFSSSIENLI